MPKYLPTEEELNEGCPLCDGTGNDREDGACACPNPNCFARQHLLGERDVRAVTREAEDTRAWERYVHLANQQWRKSRELDELWEDWLKLSPAEFQEEIERYLDSWPRRAIQGLEVATRPQLASLPQELWLEMLRHEEGSVREAAMRLYFTRVRPAPAEAPELHRAR